jgi:hypothetical protein
MSEHILEIVHTQEYGKKYCSLECDLEDSCKWNQDIYVGPNCPGPGRYRLVRIEEDERDGMLGPK